MRGGVAGPARSDFSARPLCCGGRGAPGAFVRTRPCPSIRLMGHRGRTPTRNGPAGPTHPCRRASTCGRGGRARCTSCRGWRPEAAPHTAERPRWGAAAVADGKPRADSAPMSLLGLPLVVESHPPGVVTQRSCVRGACRRAVARIVRGAQRPAPHGPRTRRVVRNRTRSRRVPGRAGAHRGAGQPLTPPAATSCSATFQPTCAAAPSRRRRGSPRGTGPRAGRRCRRRWRGRAACRRRV